MLKTLKRSKDALKLFVKDRKNNCEDTKVLNTIKNPLFWEDLENLKELLKPIYKFQIISKSSKDNLSDIKERWDDIREYLATYKDSTKLLRIFDERITK